MMQERWHIGHPFTSLRQTIFELCPGPGLLPPTNLLRSCWGRSVITSQVSVQCAVTCVDVRLTPCRPRATDMSWHGMIVTPSGYGFIQTLGIQVCCSPCNDGWMYRMLMSRYSRISTAQGIYVESLTQV